MTPSETSIAEGLSEAIPDEKLGLWCFSTEYGDPWGVFLYGHKDLGLITLEKVNEALDEAGHDEVAKIVAEHLWMIEDEEGGDHPWGWCGPGVDGAVAVTGVNFT